MGMRVDAVVAAVLFAVLGRVTVALGPVSVWGWVWLVVLHLPLVVRRRWPVVVFWTVTVTAFAAVSVGLGGPALLVVPMVAGYTLARHRSRRALWPVAVPTAAFVVGWWWHGGPLWDALAVSAAFTVAVLLGAYLQTRRAYLAALEERARRLEHEREQQDRLAVAAERARIAREMHDIVAHNLAVMVALADGAAAVTPATPQRGVDMMRQTALTGRQALTEIRRLVGLLRVSEEDGQLTPQPGLEDLDELVGQVRAAGLEVTLTRTGTCADLGPGAELAIYRIVQEALTNTIKHAGQHATAEVRLTCDGTTADVEITDDGGDRVVTPARPGHGLTGMTERAASYGGRVAAGPGTERGWRVHAHLGLDER
jgi:signal transduction histidine kinase